MSNISNIPPHNQFLYFFRSRDSLVFPASRQRKDVHHYWEVTSGRKLFTLLTVGYIGRESLSQNRKVCSTGVFDIGPSSVYSVYFNPVPGHLKITSNFDTVCRDYNIKGFQPQSDGSPHRNDSGTFHVVSEPFYSIRLSNEK